MCGLCCRVIVAGDLVGVFFFQAEDGIRDLVRSRGLGDVYKRQVRPSGWAADLYFSNAPSQHLYVP